jgi:hypothetical protein
MRQLTLKLEYRTLYYMTRFNCNRPHDSHSASSQQRIISPISLQTLSSHFQIRPLPRDFPILSRKGETWPSLCKRSQFNDSFRSHFCRRPHWIVIRHLRLDHPRTHCIYHTTNIVHNSSIIKSQHIQRCLAGIIRLEVHAIKKVSLFVAVERDPVGCTTRIKDLVYG